MNERTYQVLVVEDEPALRLLTMCELSRRGFACDAARDGMHALELATERRYDAVVSDFRMPRMSGHSLAIELLGRQDRPVIVLLTGVMEPSQAMELIAGGVDDILFKPFDHGLLAAKLRALVERRAMLCASGAGRGAG